MPNFPTKMDLGKTMALCEILAWHVDGRVPSEGGRVCCFKECTMPQMYTLESGFVANVKYTLDTLELYIKYTLYTLEYMFLNNTKTSRPLLVLG